MQSTAPVSGPTFTIYLNSILLWMGLIVVFSLVIYLLLKPANNGDTDFDNIATEMKNRNFVQNYTTFYPSAIDFKNKSSDDTKSKMYLDGDSIVWDSSLKLNFNCDHVTFVGSKAYASFSLGGGSDIVAIKNQDPSSSKCGDYWVFNYASNAAVYHDHDSAKCKS